MTIEDALYRLISYVRHYILPDDEEALDMAVGALLAQQERNWVNINDEMPMPYIDVLAANKRGTVYDIDWEAYECRN